jgi:hypothetical protein
LQTSMPMDDFIICSLRKMAFGVAVVPNAKKWARKLYVRRHGQTKLMVSVHLHCWLLSSEHEQTWFKLAGTDIRQTWSNVREMKKNKRED